MTKQNKIAPLQGNVMVVAGGIWQVPLIRYLQAKKHKVYVVDPYPDSLGVLMADEHIKADVRDVNRIIELSKNKEFEFICTDQSDIAVNTVSRLSNFFNIEVYNKEEVTDRFVNKLTMRNYAEALNIPQPAYAKVTSVSEVKSFVAKKGLPVILKPVDSQSSRGVFKLDKSNLRYIEKMVNDSLYYSQCKSLIVEEYIEGTEVTIEGVASNYRHRTLAISTKKHFRAGIASSIEYPARLPQDVLYKLEYYTNKFAEGAKLRFGLTHAEYLVNTIDNSVWLVEIACRGGGNLISSDIVKWVSGIDAYDLYYKNLTGIEVNVKKLSLSSRPALLHFFEFGKGKVKFIAGVEEVRKLPAVHKIHLDFQIGDVLTPAQDDRSRHGFFIVFANNHKELLQVAEYIKDTIKIVYE